MNLICYLGWHSWPAWRRHKLPPGTGGTYLVRICRRCGQRETAPLMTKAEEANEAALRG